MTESVWVSGQLGFPVIKVLNNIIADNMITSSKPQAAQTGWRCQFREITQRQKMR